MEKIDSLDSLEKIQEKMKVYDSLFINIKQLAVLILLERSWILEDVELYEGFCHFQEMVEASEGDLQCFREYVSFLEKGSSNFLLVDVEDELDHLSENVILEGSYLTNFIHWMTLLSLSEYKGREESPELEDALVEVMDKEFLCYQQVRINRKEIKKMQKKRRDIFE